MSELSGSGSREINRKGARRERSDDTGGRGKATEEIMCGNYRGNKGDGDTKVKNEESETGR